MALEAGTGRCQEASPASREAYIPCNAPATRMIKNRDPEPYRMCPACADHNVRNRGAEDIGPYEGPPAEGPPAEAPRGFASAAVAAEDLSAYEADAQVDHGDENILARITRVARELREAREHVVHQEELLKSAQARVRTIEEGTLPELMREAGQEKLRTSDGYDLELTETLRASVPVANMAEAIAWLTAHNQAAIIKRAMTLKFGRDENERAQEALALILEHGFVPEDKQSIHPQTLAAVIRELLAEGVDVPMPLLGAYVQPSVKLKEAKRK